MWMWHGTSRLYYALHMPNVFICIYHFCCLVFADFLKRIKHRSRMFAEFERKKPVRRTWASFLTVASVCTRLSLLLPSNAVAVHALQCLFASSAHSPPPVPFHFRILCLVTVESDAYVQRTQHINNTSTLNGVFRCGSDEWLDAI